MSAYVTIGGYEVPTRRRPGRGWQRRTRRLRIEAVFGEWIALGPEHHRPWVFAKVGGPWGSDVPGLGFVHVELGHRSFGVYIWRRVPVDARAPIR